MYGYGQEVSGFDTVEGKHQMTKDKYQIQTNSEYSEQNSKSKTETASNGFGSLKIKIWDLFVFWNLRFGISI
jgi:hypothetical protein